MSVPADVFELGSEHEQVVFANDAATGLRAIIAIHSTALGPALGGTRFYPYASTDDAVRDVLNLSRGMSYKAALAGLDLGGGKAVIIGDPQSSRPRRCCARTAGSCSRSAVATTPPATSAPTPRTWTTSPASATSSPVVPPPTAGRVTAPCSRRTASSRACAPRQRSPGASPPWRGRTVGVAGVGKVGSHLVGHLIEDGAVVVITDTHRPAVDRILEQHPQVEVVASDEALVASRLDVYAPCALGGALTDEVVETLSARIVCGGANNQLAHPGIEKALEDRGIIYAPDYCVNSGGLIQVADELEGFSFERAKQRATRHLRHHPQRPGARRQRRRAARHGGRPARRAADAYRRTAARDLADLAPGPPGACH